MESCSSGYQNLNESDRRISNAFTSKKQVQDFEMSNVTVVPDGKYSFHDRCIRLWRPFVKKKLKNIIWLCSRVDWVRPVAYKQFLRFSILLLAETYTVAQAVDAFGFGRFQVKLSLFTGLCWMADSMETTILSILSPTLQYEWQITLFQQALATTVS